MADHPINALIEAADRAITSEDFDTLIDFYSDDAILIIAPGKIAKGKQEIRNAFVAIAAHFNNSIVVSQGDMKVLEGGDTALVIMESVLDMTDENGKKSQETRRATYVYRQSVDGHWLCVIDNSYGTSILNEDWSG